MFAKLFREGDKQVLVMVASGDDGPELRFCFKMPKFGLTTVKFGFEDTDEGWDAAEAVLAKVTEEIACELADKTIEEFLKE